MARHILVLIILISSFNTAFAAMARVVDVFDGDTLNVEIQNEIVRIKLYGIDAPESGQAGNNSSTRFLKHLVLNDLVDLKMVNTDVFGRSLAVLTRAGQKLSINATIVANGYAWVKPNECEISVCDELIKLESQAKLLKLGIWSGHDLVPPWAFLEQQTR